MSSTLSTLKIVESPKSRGSSARPVGLVAARAAEAEVDRADRRARPGRRAGTAARARGRSTGRSRSGMRQRRSERRWVAGPHERRRAGRRPRRRRAATADPPRNQPPLLAITPDDGADDGAGQRGEQAEAPRAPGRRARSRPRTGRASRQDGDDAEKHADQLTHGRPPLRRRRRLGDPSMCPGRRLAAPPRTLCGYRAVTRRSPRRRLRPALLDLGEGGRARPWRRS